MTHWCMKIMKHMEDINHTEGRDYFLTVEYNKHIINLLFCLTQIPVTPEL